MFLTRLFIKGDASERQPLISKGHQRHQSSPATLQTDDTSETESAFAPQLQRRPSLVVKQAQSIVLSEVNSLPVHSKHRGQSRSVDVGPSILEAVVAYQNANTRPSHNKAL